jgi:hypothetical protein
VAPGCIIAETPDEWICAPEELLQTMDLNKAIQSLYAEKEKLERVIASLEELLHAAQAAPKAGKRRGRKSMPAAERAEVSERMKKYWAGRRQDMSGG